MPKLLSDDDVLDYITDPAVLTRRVPRYIERFDAIREEQHMSEAFAQMTSWGRRMGGTGEMKRVATIPHAVLEAMLRVQPDLLLDKRKFYAWLDRHEAYQAYRRSNVGSRSRPRSPK